MSEQLNLHKPTTAQPETISSVTEIQRGLEVAQALGFSLDQALRHDHPELDTTSLEDRKRQVIETSNSIAAEIQLDEGFFNNPANTILMTTIADSWLSNDERSRMGNHKESLAREREMLVDVALILGGDASGFARSLVKGGDPEGARYINDNEDTDDIEKADFFESITDPELSAEVSAVLAERGDGSFLSKIRDRFGLNADKEREFTVRVLRIGDQYDLRRAGLELPEAEVPEWKAGMTDEEQKEFYRLNDLATKNLETQETILAPYKQAEKDYEDKFGEKYGPLAPAFLTIKTDGRIELTISAPDAMVLINSFRDGKSIPMDQKDIEDSLATIKHEFGHTQKQLMIGAHHQLGLLLEERKAELLSGDRLGYQDVKYLFQDVRLASGVDTLAELDHAVRQEDPLSTFLSRVAPVLGLRASLLLMASKPLPYDKNPDYSKKFADIKCIQNITDKSSLDIVVRELIQKRGKETIKSNVKTWVGKMAEDGTDMTFMQESYIPYRRAHGLNHGTDYMIQAIDEHISEQNK